MILRSQTSEIRVDKQTHKQTHKQTNRQCKLLCRYIKNWKWMAIIDIYWNATLYGKYSLVGIKDILLHEINFSHTCFICRADEARCLQLPTSPCTSQWIKWFAPRDASWRITSRAYLLIKVLFVSKLLFRFNFSLFHYSGVPKNHVYTNNCA